MMNMIHTSVPWYAAIPLTAFVTRGLLVTSFGSWARALMARYIGLQPLRQNLAFQKRDDILKRGGFRSPKEATLVVKQEVNQLVSKLDQRWKVSIWGQVGWTLGQIPIFFIMAETIRQKCAAREGLLGLGFSAFRAEDATAAVGEVALNTSKWFEPSLATEGMLWFPDLLVADPTGVLPFIVSGLMFTNVYITKNSPDSVTGWPLAFRRILLGFSLLIGPLCQNVPAALLLYWAGSTTSVMGSTAAYCEPTPPDFAKLCPQVVCSVELESVSWGVLYALANWLQNEHERVLLKRPAQNFNWDHVDINSYNVHILLGICINDRFEPDAVHLFVKVFLFADIFKITMLRLHALNRLVACLYGEINDWK
ncbi:hypothetical protein ACEQ8H_001949 [Pleosporales sp. CAS-2024a]